MLACFNLHTPALDLDLIYSFTSTLDVQFCESQNPYRVSLLGAQIQIGFLEDRYWPRSARQGRDLLSAMLVHVHRHIPTFIIYNDTASPSNGFHSFDTARGCMRRIYIIHTQLSTDPLFIGAYPHTYQRFDARVPRGQLLQTLPYYRAG